MAFSTPLIGKSGDLLTAYNIDWSVGRIGSNTREDVMLVQALFKIFYYELLGFNHDLDPPPGQTEVIVVDGYYGPITQKHITHFQAQAIALGQKVLPDGIFDPFRAPGASSTLSKSRYALDLLNNGCANCCKEQGIDNYTNLPNRADMPLLLRSALKKVKKTASKYTYVAPQTVPTTGGA
ncbi:MULTISPECIES: peptidoglycan-binding domain-containing protein [Variovorax]|jgi:peptidoglycan hydrolase-like protein with peptidoglycan-binding domain|uniref:peptidoglycan-binding domain-containing protein n=1 Tax=Variovorax TaxID=34072 RepID=UPI000372AD07|nr:MULTISPECIES: peptidoglycan-binding domain-containing protein [Variovorax]MBB3639975.1 peptidoglycan hydrolase-like protein with peptidoglycan-binding domain [Variovorax sp. BK613]RTD90961.1 peptidoglycan-binding protein [Variovorax sp. 369]